MNKNRKGPCGIHLMMGESYRPKEKRYVYSYTDRAGDRHWLYAKTVAELREKEERLQRSLILGIDVIRAKQITLNDMVDNVLKDKEKDLAPSTIQNYRAMYDNHIRDKWGKMKVADIRFSDIKKMYKTIIHEDGLSPRTVRGFHNVVHEALYDAVRDGIISNNPADGIWEKMYPKGVPKKKRISLTEKEEKVFLAYIENHPIYSHWYPVFIILLRSGMRVGELIGLRWSDINCQTRIIDVNHALIRLKKSKTNDKDRLAVSTTKTKNGIREIPMMDCVVAAFESIYEEQSINGFCEAQIDGMKGFIFKNSSGNVLTDTNINAAIKRIVETYNREEEINAAKENREPFLLPMFSAHNCRHTYATRLCSIEDNVKTASYLMGHASVRTTMDIYADVNKCKVRKSIDQMDEKWDSLYEDTD